MAPFLLAHMPGADGYNSDDKVTEITVRATERGTTPECTFFTYVTISLGNET
jgi:hypothetical protein